MKISVLTATYNRGKYLNKLYKSLVDNMNYGLEIEWIIVDDGSIDKTKKNVDSFREENKFDIKYIYQENHGKMYAINEAVRNVTGDLIVDCDSDDFFSNDAFKIIKENSKYLKSNKKIYALCFLKTLDSGKISGNEFEKNYKVTTMFDLYFKEGGSGEKILVFNSKIRKKYMHEIEVGEKFVTEARMYHKMDEKYNIMCINKVIEIGNYLDDGYTKNLKKTFSENPKGYYYYFKEILKKDRRGIKFRKRIYIWKNYLKFLIFVRTQKIL